MNEKILSQRRLTRGDESPPNRVELTIRDDILAGNAIFTITSQRTGRRITYRVCRHEADDKTLHFVSVLRDSSSERGKFLGTIFNKQTFKIGKRSKSDDQSVEAKSFRWIWNHIDRLDYKPVEITFHRGGQHEPLTSFFLLDPRRAWTAKGTRQEARRRWTFNLRLAFDRTASCRSI